MKRRITANFFYVSEAEEYPRTIDDLLNLQKGVIDSGKVDNVEAGGHVLRITYIEKMQRDDHTDRHWWVGILEKLDTSSEGEIANLDGKRTAYATKPDEGTIVNTGFAYYPFTQTLVLHKKTGGVNDKVFGVYLRKLIRQTGIIPEKSSKFIIELIPDLKKLFRLENAHNIKFFEYTYKMPENAAGVQKEQRPILGDIYLARKLKADKITVRLSAKDGLEVLDTIAKAKNIIQISKKDDISTLKAISEHNGIEEPLDLINEKLTDYLDVELAKNKKETPTLVMETINNIFKKQRRLLETMYINKD
ncbi:hypothetical protein [Alkalihalophilus marmarensis]|uniref:Uncharacterized protein n=1 Tax=Alkalihalophilus marmarensis DSM 21297 TaxID=1188261 RepID=U6SMC1_9BACI|nr:hypothetical protein [Alkalihalophilus marmarensis]ERN52839.1 hypothetical protein A33I_14200 [Alkalihalophilus marmarensis DSM 21297]